MKVFSIVMFAPVKGFPESLSLIIPLNVSWANPQLIKASNHKPINHDILPDSLVNKFFLNIRLILKMNTTFTINQ